MNNIVAFSKETRAGTFWIRQSRDGRWQAMFEDEGLGSYHRPAAAAEDLAAGATFWPSCGNPSQFGLPEELTDWQAHRAR